MPEPIAATLTPEAQPLYEAIAGLPIVSPHGHCDPAWWASDAAFPNPAALLIQPDHYVFRMLYSQGVDLARLGLGAEADPRAVFQVFADHWDLFLGTPSRMWLEQTLYGTLGLRTPLRPETAPEVYDEIDARLVQDDFRPRALFDRFGIEVLATTDPATADLADHQAIAASGWGGRIIPTFRPDDLLNPAQAGHGAALKALATQTGRDLGRYDQFLAALAERRAVFKAAGATATDHAITHLHTNWLDRPQIEALHAAALSGQATPQEAAAYYGHLLIEMAQMSVEDGLVMQLHAGSQRNTNPALFAALGPDMGADIPVPTPWTEGLGPLLARVGTAPGLRIILFTLDESTYARELAPMAGHWPCLRIGPPWWFHDSLNGIARFLDRVVETAGYQNLAGFNDDTRAFLSIPARHDLWRRGVALHLGAQVTRGVLRQAEADRLAPALATDLARAAYRLEG